MVFFRKSALYVHVSSTTNICCKKRVFKTIIHAAPTWMRLVVVALIKLHFSGHCCGWDSRADQHIKKRGKVGWGHPVFRGCGVACTGYSMANHERSCLDLLVLEQDKAIGVWIIAKLLLASRCIYNSTQIKQ